MEITTTIATNIRTSSAITGGVLTPSSGEFGDYDTIVNHLLKQKYQLMNKTREKFTGSINRTTKLKPLTMIESSKQPGKTFICTGYSFNVTKDSYDVSIEEYDNTTTIDLTEG